MALVMLVGCKGGEEKKEGENPTPTANKADIKWTKDSLKITMIAKSNENPVFQSAKVGAEAAAKDLTAKTGVKISIDWQTPPTDNAAEQAKRVEAAVAGGTDAILISLSNADKVTPAIDAAVAKEIPVMTFDSDAPNSKRFAFYGTDDAECGQLIMAELARVCGEKGNFAIIAGDQNAPNLQKRVKGAREEAKKHPGMKFVDTFYHQENPQDAAKAVQSAMKANPQIDAWAMIGGWPLFTTSLLDLDPKKVRIVACDALPAQLAYVEKGIAPTLFAQPTYSWGEESVKIIVDKMVYGKEVKAINKMELVKVTKDNLKEWANKLKTWGFEVPETYLK
jgi:ribose transport system substrate-binding protein